MNSRNNKKEFRIKKVPVLNLIELLTELYDSGADFVDIVKDTTVEGGDAMGIVVFQDYYTDKTELTNDDIERLLE